MLDSRRFLGALAFVTVLVATLPLAAADPTNLTCTSTPDAFTCTLGAQSGAAPAPVAQAFYLVADAGFEEAVALGVCPPEGSCISNAALGMDTIAHTGSDGVRTYTGTITLLP